MSCFDSIYQEKSFEKLLPKLFTNGKNEETEFWVRVRTYSRSILLLNAAMSLVTNDVSMKERGIVTNCISEQFFNNSWMYYII